MEADETFIGREPDIIVGHLRAAFPSEDARLRCEIEAALAAS